MRRRFNIVPFTRKPAHPDPNLETKLQEEWPAILRWLIEGCLDWQAVGLIRPPIVLDATAEYFRAQDVFGEWLDERCDVEPGNLHKTAAAGELFAAWSSFAAAAGEKPGTTVTFADDLGKRGLVKARTNALGRHYQGIRLLAGADHG